MVTIEAGSTSDLTLQSGTFTFSSAAETHVNQNLVLAVDDNQVESCECFDATITDPSDAADEIGAIGTAQICVLDADGIDSSK